MQLQHLARATDTAFATHTIRHPAHRGLRPAPMRALALVAVGLLVGACQSTPGPGSETRAQVTELPAQRGDLRGGHRYLHPALRAGVTRADLEAGRLVRGECAEPDAGRPQGRRWVGVTALLPAGTPVTLRSLIEVDTAGDAGPLRHGRYRGPGPALDATTGFATEPGGERLAVWCRPPGAAAGSALRVLVRGTVPAWEHAFAVAEMQRHDRFSDADFAQGRVAVVRCQLKVVDGGDWHAPDWLARVPPGLALRPGDVVRLRAGAVEGSTDTDPEPQVLARVDGERGPGGNAVVRCG